MSFSYLYPEYDAGAGPPPPQPPATSGGIQFQIPDYLYDAPPTLASGGGAEAFHPAVAAQWLANSGFRQTTHYPSSTGLQYPAVANAWSSLSALQSHFSNPDAGAGMAFGMGLGLLAGAYEGSNNASNTASSGWGDGNDDADPQQYPSRASYTPSPPLPQALTAGLPVYSQSGFDVVSLLARVQSRKNPQVTLGPIDFTTSFVIADVRRHDTPIVYCSPSFCALTGYREGEVLGRNCRFLQAPPTTSLTKGAPRQHTSGAAVRSLAKAIAGAKETQVSVVNYRKDGSAFVNLVSIVPLSGEFADPDEDDQDEWDGNKGRQGIVWYVGFQVDLGRQSEGIVERVRDGSYYKGAVLNAAAVPKKEKEKAEPPSPLKEKRTAALPAPRVSQQLARLVTTPAFLATCAVHSANATGGIPPDPASHVLHCLLLQELPDFVHVVTLKGAFLYVAPAVTRVLGYAPAELVGRALADICFPKDVVAVTRALKEASLPVEGFGDPAASKGAGPIPVPPEALRPVDLVFRAKTSLGKWVWVECRGRLHVEPGKGRKAIVLVGRARAMAHVADVEPPSSRSSPVTPSQPSYAKRPRFDSPTSTLGSPSPSNADEHPSAATPTAFSGLLDPYGLLLSVGAGSKALLGWEPDHLRRTRIGELVAPDMRLSAASSPNTVDAMLAAIRRDADAGLGAGITRHVQCTLRGADGQQVAVVVVVTAPLAHDTTLPPGVGRARLMYAVRSASMPGASAPLGPGLFDKLNIATGGGWQYELQQLRFANARLEEEIAELERAERERAAENARRRDHEDQQRREADVYSQQIIGAMVPRYYEETPPPPPPPQWASYPGASYQIPAKRPWDRRD
ncbi:hypothetical protein FB45DRAFT_908901 [Roridomyces roridus]|uniref:PAS domain-containing protein n=1 Tax=Roridomyces roridus TaxID=1738132 RepID=A0AAD7BYL9_9AGAR|nr:hypothetical protein FB45DRAFT_908901 [Roridomyces roridus]